MDTFMNQKNLIHKNIWLRKIIKHYQTKHQQHNNNDIRY